MSLPGANFARKPYIDDGSPLPEIGQRVRLLTGDKAHFEGTVIAVDVPNRAVHVDGFTYRPYPPAREELKVWIPWRDLEITAEDHSARLVPQ